MHLTTSPENLNDINKSNKTLFLAGSIEMDAAIDWQTEIISRLGDLPINILNPRRREWDKSWVQESSNVVFKGQVEWELEGILEVSDIICFYFDPATQSPITLLELGLSLATNKEIIVCCPRGYWRKGNVDITCSKYGAQVLEDCEMFVNVIRERVLEN